MLADPTGAFTKVKPNIFPEVLYVVHSSIFVFLLFRLLTCCSTATSSYRYLETSDPRGI